MVYKTKFTKGNQGIFKAVYRVRGGSGKDREFETLAKAKTYASKLPSALIYKTEVVGSYI